MSTGFKIIREMSKDELIEELLAAQKEVMQRTDVDTLKRHVITFRTAQVQQRLCEEADLAPQHIIGFLGTEEG